MSPSIDCDSFVITKSVRSIYTINQLFVFKHSVYGNLVKKLINIDTSNLYWFEGINNSSISSSSIGPIKKEQIIGQVIFSVSKSSSRFYLWFAICLLKPKK